MPLCKTSPKNTDAPLSLSLRADSTPSSALFSPDIRILLYSRVMLLFFRNMLASWMAESHFQKENGATPLSLTKIKGHLQGERRTADSGRIFIHEADAQDGTVHIDHAGHSEQNRTEEHQSGQQRAPLFFSPLPPQDFSTPKSSIFTPRRHGTARRSIRGGPLAVPRRSTVQSWRRPQRPTGFERKKNKNNRNGPTSFVLKPPGHLALRSLPSRSCGSYLRGMFPKRGCIQEV